MTDVSPRPSAVATARRAVAFGQPHRDRLAMSAVFLTLQNVLQLGPLIIFRDLVTQLADRHPHFSALVVLIGIALGAMLISALCGVVAETLTAAVSEGIVFDLREQLLDRFLLQPVGYFTARRSGEIMSNLVNDVEAVDNIIAQSLMTLVRSGGYVIGMLILMFAFSWQLALLTLIVVPIGFLPARIGGRASYRTRLAVQEQLSEMTAYLQEILGMSGVMLIKAFARSQRERETFREINVELRRREIRAALATRWLTMLLTVLQATGPIVVLLIGGLLISHGQSGVGTVLTFTTIVVGQLGSQFQSLGTAGFAVIGSLAAWERIFAVLDLTAEIADRPDAHPLTDPVGRVRFSSVSYRYPAAERAAVDDICADLEPGCVTALVGPSGAGKTTLSALLSRFIDPTHGSVSIDECDLRDLTLESIQATVGIVFQDAFLFHTTLRENLRYGRPEASDEEILDVARAMALDGVIEHLPEGLDTVVGERGHRLSGGEKQRVALARVLLKDPKILILDEATAHLDTASERLVQEALGRLLVGRTSLVIAHRLSTVMAADQILVLERGQIVQRGTHHELLAEGGLYAELYTTTLSGSSPATLPDGNVVHPPGS